MNVTDLFCKSRRILACLLVTFTSAYGQKDHNLLDKRVRVSAENVNVDALGDIITRQTGLILSFNSQKVGARQQVRLHQSSYTTRQLLALIKEATGADYTIYQEHVIFHRAIKTPQPERKKSPATASIPVKRSPAPVKQAPPVSTYQLHTIGGIKADTVLVEPPQTLLVEKPVITAGIPLNDNRIDSATIKAPRRERQRWRFHMPASFSGNGLFSAFAQAGFATDETFYTNLQVKAGLGIIYAIGGWSSNFSVSGFRYGLGASVPLGKDWRLQLEGTTGTLSKDARATVFPDTASQHQISVSSRLHRIGLFVQKNIGSRLALHGGPVFSHLKNTIYDETAKLSLEGISLYAPHEVNSFYTIKPHYTIGSSAVRPTENKIWIGLQLGISYRF